MLNIFLCIFFNFNLYVDGHVHLLLLFIDANLTFRITYYLKRNDYFLHTIIKLSLRKIFFQKMFNVEVFYAGFLPLYPFPLLKKLLGLADELLLPHSTHWFRYCWQHPISVMAIPSCCDHLGRSHSHEDWLKSRNKTKAMNNTILRLCLSFWKKKKYAWVLCGIKLEAALWSQCSMNCPQRTIREESQAERCMCVWGKGDSWILVPLF